MASETPIAMQEDMDREAGTCVPVVSVIMPAYNHENYVERAIRSVWEQTYRNLELIVLDDGSSDRTPDIIESLYNQSAVPMHFVPKTNEGVCRTLNRGLALAKGKYIVTLASDDEYPPDSVEKAVAALEKSDPAVAGVYGDHWLMDLAGNKSKRVSLLSRSRYDTFIGYLFGKAGVNALGLCYKKSVIDHVGPFDESLSYEDTDMILRILRQNYRFEYIPEILYSYRLGLNHASSDFNKHDNTIWRIIEKHIDDPRLGVTGKRRIIARTWLGFASRSYACLDPRMDEVRRYSLKSISAWPFCPHAYRLFLRSLLSSGMVKRLREVRRKRLTGSHDLPSP